MRQWTLEQPCRFAVDVDLMRNKFDFKKLIDQQTLNRHTAQYLLVLSQLQA